MKLIRFRRLNSSHWEIAFNERQLWSKLNGEVAEIIMPARPWIVRMWRKLFPLKFIECSARIVALIICVCLTGCATFSAFIADPNTAKAETASVNAIAAYFSGNPVGAVIAAAQGAAFILRATEGTSKAGTSSAVWNAVLEAGASPELANIVTNIVATAQAKGAAPNVAVETAALSIDAAVAKVAK